MKKNLLAKLADPQIPGRTFLGWYDSSTDDNLFNFNSNTHIYAKWNPPSYSISFHTNGGMEQWQM